MNIEAKDLIATIQTLTQKAQAVDTLVSAMLDVVDTLEAYCEDHNSDQPTDPTVLLPDLYEALRSVGVGAEPEPEPETEPEPEPAAVISHPCDMCGVAVPEGEHCGECSEYLCPDCFEATDEEPTIDDLIQSFVWEVTAMVNKHHVRMTYPPITRTEHGIDWNRKYARVWQQSKGNSNSRSVYCFIDRSTGAILKSASWSAPAKGIRGFVTDENRMQSVDIYGARYLR